MTTPWATLAAALVWFGVLVGLGVAAGSLLELAEAPDGSTPFDNSITSWFVDHRTGALTALARALSGIGSQRVLVPVVLVLAGFLLVRRRLVLASVLVVAWGGATGLYNVVKHIVGRSRPPMDIWITHPGGSAFPSGHATQSLATFAAIAFVVAVVAPRARWPSAVLAAVLALGVGLSRVYLGVHWASDVIAGWLIALAWVGIVLWLGSRSLQAGGATRHLGTVRRSCIK
jgi:membrane-associated phospholipid phosphatase